VKPERGGNCIPINGFTARTARRDGAGPPRYRTFMWEIRSEREGDEAAIEALVDSGFGPGRFAKTAYRLREGVAPIPSLCFIAQSTKNGALLGSVRFWPIVVGGRASLLLGPLAVEPELRGQGIGIALMQKGLEAARASGQESVILVGDEPYYARVGFARLKPGQVRFPGPVDPNRVLGLALKDGALDSLSGEIERARIDIPVSAQGAPLA
jgi:predicted N-acetyltransferase YhbS